MVTAERDQIPTTPVPISTRSVCIAAAVAGPKESANVISGNHALRKPAASARPAKSIAIGAGSAVRNRPSWLACGIAATLSQRYWFEAGFRALSKDQIVML